MCLARLLATACVVASCVSSALATEMPDLAGELSGSEPAFALSLDGERLTLERARRRQLAPDVFVWSGTVAGAPGSSALFVSRRGRVSGDVLVDGRLFEIRPDESGSLAVRAVDPVVAETCQALSVERSLPELPEPLPVSADDGSLVDLMVVYTPRALDENPDVEAEILLAVEHANVAYENSGIAHRVRLVDVRLVDHDQENWAPQTLLNRLRLHDGHMDEVHEWRDACGADLVTLWMGGNGLTCGVAYTLRDVSLDSENEGFSVVRDSCASNVLAHELGHSMGAHHDWEATSDPGAWSWSKGHVQDPCGVRTVMAYAGSLGCPRELYFSNPELMHDGRPLGVPEGEPFEANNARTLNETAMIVSNYRQSSTGCCDPDGFEPDDDCAAGVPDIRVGDEQARSFCEDALDWARVDAVEGETYAAETFDLAPGVDTTLRLYRDDCRIRLAEDEDGGTGVGSRIEWTASYTGAYYLRVHPVGGGLDTGVGRTYSLRLVGGVPPREPSAVGSAVPLRVLKGVVGELLVDVEDIAEATAYVAYEGSLSGGMADVTRTCMDAWMDRGASVRLDGRLMAAASWVVIAAANEHGESSPGQGSAMEDRRSTVGWPAGAPCP